MNGTRQRSGPGSDVKTSPGLGDRTARSQPGTTRRLRIALMGTRGVPARYGGFETFYENLGPRLASRGHDVVVYVRPHVTLRPELRRYRGMTLVPLPSIHQKHLETISHTLLSSLHVLGRRVDVALVCGVGNAPVSWLPRLSGTRIVLNVDSSDWARSKWGPIARAYLRGSARLAATVANVVVADNPAIQEDYDRDLHVQVRYIAYGADETEEPGDDVLRELGLIPRGYLLWVGRLEPETKVEELIEAFWAVDAPDLHLVIVGDAPYATAFRERVYAAAGPRVHLAGYRFGRDYRQLVHGAFAYVQTSPTAGTSPALLEEMAAGNAVIVRGTRMNCAVIGDAGMAYDPDDPVAGLSAAITRLVADPAAVPRLGAMALERVRSTYSWEYITDQYEDLFRELVAGSLQRER